MIIQSIFTNNQQRDQFSANATQPKKIFNRIAKFHGVTIQMKPLQQYFHMALFIEYVVLTFESVDEILWCYHSNETFSAVLSHGTIYLVCSSNF